MAKNETETETVETFAYAVKAGRHVRFEEGKRVVYSPRAGDENVIELTEAQAKPFGKSLERIATPTLRASKSAKSGSNDDSDTSDDTVIDGIPDTAEKFIEMIEGEEELTKLATYEKHERERSAGPRKTVLAAIAEQRKLLK